VTAAGGDQQIEAGAFDLEGVALQLQREIGGAMAVGGIRAVVEPARIVKKREEFHHLDARAGELRQPQPVVEYSSPVGRAVHAAPVEREVTADVNQQRLAVYAHAVTASGARPVHRFGSRHSVIAPGGGRQRFRNPPAQRGRSEHLDVGAMAQDVACSLFLVPCALFLFETPV